MHKTRFTGAVFIGPMQTNTHSLDLCILQGLWSAHRTSYQKPQRLLLKGVTLHSGTPSLSNTQAHRLSVAVLACS